MLVIVFINYLYNRFGESAYSGNVFGMTYSEEYDFGKHIFQHFQGADLIFGIFDQHIFKNIFDPAIGVVINLIGYIFRKF